MYIDSSGNIILKGDPFRLKHTVVNVVKKHRSNNIIISNTKPAVLTVTGSFSFTQKTFNIVTTGGYHYESPDQLLSIWLENPATGLLVQYGATPSYVIPMEYMDVDDTMVHTMHSQPVFITGEIA